MIRLTKQTDYALVLLAVMARESETERWTAGDLAERSGLPAPMVSKILKVLSREGILESHRGSKGGYSLTAPADTISVSEVIALFEGPIGLTACSQPDAGDCECDLAPTCPAAGSWGLISQAVSQALDGLTVEELARPHAPKARGEMAGAMAPPPGN